MDKRMHIGYFTNTYRPTMSGVVRSVATFRQALTELGHNVFIFAQHATNYTDDEPFIFRYPAIEIPFANDYAFPIPLSPVVNEVLPILKLDVIHSHHPFLLGETAANKAKDLGLPLVFTFHTRYDEYSHYVPFDQKITKQVIVNWIARYLERCHHIITPSESIRQMLRDYGVEGDITSVPTGINLAPYAQAQGAAVRRKHGWGDDTVLITVGRLAKEKNFETVIDAAARVMTDRDDVRLVIVGGGLEKDSLEAYARKSRFSDRIEFTGTVPYEEVPNYLKAADLFVFASVTETQGLVTMEAMAAGLPIVAVAATGTSDAVVDGEQGLLTENDSAALAHAICRVLDDEALRERLYEGVEE